MRARSGISTLALILWVPTLAHGKTETLASVDVGANVGFSNNPFSATGSGNSSGYAAVDITPQVEWRGEHSSLSALGSAHVDQYFTRYPTTDSYRGSLSYRSQPSSKLTLFSRIDVSSAVLGGYQDSLSGFAGSSGANGAAGSGTGTTATGANPDGAAVPLFGDIGLFGTRERRRSLNATTGFSTTLSERNSVNGSAFVDLARYRTFGPVSNFNGYGGNLAYSRKLSDYTNVGLQGSFSRYAYESGNDNTNVYSIQATGSTRLSERWTAQGALGVSFVKSSAAGSSNSASISGNFSACRRGPLTNLCASVSRTARASGFNGSQYVTSGGIDYSRRLDERSSLALSAFYSREGGLRSLNNAQNEYLQISPSYSRQVRERLRVAVSGRYRQVFGGAFSRPADYGAEAGIFYHFGRM